ncbi:dienelactone hydrolase family protein [Nonomuraea sp. NPDC050691]|uniref:dienelactone hydrolase family protein n=1 Tax=Nonomuraea sp. NPDC050691 TaxID=3155661 RepID=UPI0033E9532C
MAEILLFHHIQGQTTGFLRFADELRQAGHTVHTPDLFAGCTFACLDDGQAHAEKIGFDKLLKQGVRTADTLPNEMVYAGWSLGVMAAQTLAQTRPGARGVLLIEACLPASEWPEDLPVQIHGMDADPFFAGEGDLAAARTLVASAQHSELFVYPGDRHLFADASLPSYDAHAAALLMRRALDFLGRTAP